MLALEKPRLDLGFGAGLVEIVAGPAVLLVEIQIGHGLGWHILARENLGEEVAAVAVDRAPLQIDDAGFALAAGRVARGR